MKTRTNRFDLERVHYIPNELADGRLYFSREYSIAVHRCACGCGNAVFTPVKKGEWALFENDGLPTLSPSIGSWNLPCRSHYFIRRGRVEWAADWSDDRVAAGRAAEDRRRSAVHHVSWWKRFIRRILNWRG